MNTIFFFLKTQSEYKSFCDQFPTLKKLRICRFVVEPINITFNKFLLGAGISPPTPIFSCTQLEKSHTAHLRPLE